ncbi:unnamed protein product [Blumeria hordei]|uniref:Retrovirus-related Pol polyprotein from transposon TNT 1-94-like beta-barrel domain-containing protein n=1 Tax=Blumeria hordei TaxID=2867405 RepID=A0A383UM26_BLUHO|nr:unnamed protein product [Blumeria hordei]
MRQKSTRETAGMARAAFDSTGLGANDWSVDSSATSYMSHDKSIFIEYANHNSTVGTAKNAIDLNVTERGKLCSEINRQSTTFEGVLHILERKANLLSPRNLTSAGISLILGSKDVVIKRDE